MFSGIIKFKKDIRTSSILLLNCSNVVYVLSILFSCSDVNSFVELRILSSILRVILPIRVTFPLYLNLNSPIGSLKNELFKGAITLSKFK